MGAAGHVRLFEPLRIGSVTLKNRLVMSPMGSQHTRDGLPTTADIEWHADRAFGGVGLIVTGGTMAHESSQLRGRGGIEAWTRDAVPALRARVDAVHAGGAKIFGQLLHLGRETVGGQSDAARWAPSAIRSPRELFEPHEMSRAEVLEVIEGFAISAHNLMSAGYDGIEIQACHGYLAAEFLSPDTNRRTDEFGGETPRERMTFLVEILRAAREVCGADVPIGVRLSGTEELPHGIQLDDTIEMVRALDEEALVDYVSVTRGVRHAYVKDNTAGFGVAVAEAKAVKAATSVPVLVTGRITTPELAASILEQGAADLIGLGRALIADAQWVAKAAGTVLGEIRPCVGWVQECRSSQAGVTCAVNAAAGREAIYGLRVSLPSSSARVVVVGGGPGGLEAARLAAERGCRVTLYEADDSLGGQLLRAARGPLRSDLMGFVAYAESELRRLRVDVMLGTRAHAANVSQAEPNLVVVAAGAIHEPVSVPGGAMGHVLSVWDLLDGAPRSFGGTAIVVDDGSGSWPGISAAELLISKGVHVTFVTPSASVGGAIPPESAALVHQRLRRAGTVYRPFEELLAINGAGATVRDMVSGHETDLRADKVVVLTRAVAQTSVLEQLTSAGLHAVAIGDAVAPRRMTAAILDANRVINTFAGGARSLLG